MTTPLNPTLHQEAAEAICSALYRTGFEALGDTEGGRVTWFHRGDAPKDVRVRVERSVLADYVYIVVEFRNLSNGARLKGEQKFEVYAGPMADRPGIEKATLQTLVGVLEVFHDVLAGEGVAGPLAALGGTAGTGPVVS